MDESRRRRHAGETVMARYRDGEWYAAEISKVIDDGYQVEWFDGSRKSRVGEDSVQSIPLDSAPKHRFGIGQRIIGDYDGVWCSGKVAGLFDFGYHVDWENGSERSRILESEAETFPVAETVRAGSEVLGLYEEGDWYPARLKSIFEEGYEIVWADGSGAVIIPQTNVIPLPAPIASESATRPIDKEADAAAQSLISEEMAHFQQYFERRVRGGELSADNIDDEQFCPHCKKRHLVKWFKDKTYESIFFLCNSTSEARIILRPPENHGLMVLTIDELLTKFPAVPKEQTSFLKKLFDSSQVEISAFPPFISLSIKHSGKR